MNKTKKKDKKKGRGICKKGGKKEELTVMALRCDMFVPFQLIGEFCSASNSYQQFCLFFSLDSLFVSCPFQTPT